MITIAIFVALFGSLSLADLEAGKKSCAGQCLRKLSANINESAVFKKHVAQEEKHALSICHWYDVEKIQESCNKSNEAAECVNACGDDPYKKLAAVVLSHSFCDEATNFTQDFPCINGNCDSVDKVCEAQCSNGSDKDLHVLIEIKHDHKKELDKEKTIKALQNACSYLHCYQNCSAPILNEKCNVDTAQVFVDRILSSVKVVKDILKLTGRGDHFPQQCMEIVAEDESESASASAAGAAGNDTAVELLGADVTKEKHHHHFNYTRLFDWN